MNRYIQGAVSTNSIIATDTNLLKMIFKKYFSYLLIALSAELFSSCDKAATVENEAEKEFCIPDSLMKNISFDTLKTESVMSTLRLSGKIACNDDHVINIFPLVGGHVTKVQVSLGDYVKKGALLAVVRSSDMANYLNDFKSAKSELVVAKKNLEVAEEMKNSGVSSEKDYIISEGEFQKAIARFNHVNEIMHIYGSSAEESDSAGSSYLIKSPIDGFIVEKNVNAGMELRADDANRLFTISDLKEVWATANVYESDIAGLKLGDNVEITTLSYPDRKFTGKVERIANMLNPETNAITVKIRLSNADYSLKPGMFANISVFFPEQQNMFVVPSRSVLFDDNKSYIVLFHKRCDVDMKQVKVYKTFNEKCYILADSIQEGALTIAGNGLFVFTALKKLN